MLSTKNTIKVLVLGAILMGEVGYSANPGPENFELLKTKLIEDKKSLTCVQRVLLAWNNAFSGGCAAVDQEARDGRAGLQAPEGQGRRVLVVAYEWSNYPLDPHQVVALQAWQDPSTVHESLRELWHTLHPLGLREGIVLGHEVARLVGGQHAVIHIIKDPRWKTTTTPQDASAARDLADAARIAIPLPLMDRFKAVAPEGPQAPEGQGRRVLVVEYKWSDYQQDPDQVVARVNGGVDQEWQDPSTAHESHAVMGLWHAIHPLGLLPGIEVGHKVARCGGGQDAVIHISDDH